MLHLSFRREKRGKHVAGRQLVNCESRQQRQEIIAPTHDDDITLCASRNRGLLEGRLYGDDLDSDSEIKAIN